MSTTTHRRSLVSRMAGYSAAHPWRMILAWFVFLALCLGLGAAVGTHKATAVDFRVGEAGRAEAMADAGGLTVPASEKVLITDADGGTLDRRAADAAATDVVSRMRALPEVGSVGAPIRSEDGRAVLVTVNTKGDQVAAKQNLEAMTGVTSSVAAAHPGLRIEQTGDASIGKGTDQQRGEDLLLSEKITMPVTLLILLIVFGALLAAAVPVLLAVSAILASMGLSAVFSHLVPDAGVGASVIILLGMAVGVDYSLFYVSRERQERRRSGGVLSHRAALELAAETSGRAVVVSGIAVIASTACLYVAGDVIFSSLATAAIVTVTVAVISSLTVLPAVLALLGARIDRPRVPFLRHEAGSGDGRRWEKLLRPAIQHPGKTLVVSLLIVLALAAPALTMNLNQPGKNTFSDKIPAVATYHRVIQEFPDQTAQHLVVVRNDDPARAAQVRSALADLDRRVAATPAFGRVGDGREQFSPDRRVTLWTLGIPLEATSPQAVETLRLLRTQLLPETVGQVPGTQYAVSGDVARAADYVDNQTARTPLVVGLVLLLTFVMMVIAFRSVVIGVVAVGLNLLSAAAAFGALVLVFQHEWAEGLLDFTSYGFISARVPLFLFVILFGVSMDYQVFLVSRIHEGVRSGLTTREAVFEGITRSAGVVTSAAVVMVSVFVSFMFLHLVEVKQLGFGLAVAVLVDACIVRVMILPAVMMLLRRAAWWPSRAVWDRAAPTPDAGDSGPADAFSVQRSLTRGR